MNTTAQGCFTFPRMSPWRFFLLIASGLLILSGLCVPFQDAVASPQSPPPLRLTTIQGEINLAPYSEFLVDPEGTLDWDSVKKPEHAVRFRPLPGGKTLNLGITRDIVWLRVRFDVPPEAAGRRLLELAYAPLDDVAIEWQGQHLEAGDQIPAAQRPFWHRFHVFPINLSAATGQVLLLRIRTDSNLSAPLTLWQPDALHRNDMVQYVVFALYFGMFIALGGYNFLLWLSLKEAAYLGYVGYVGMLGLGMASLLGFAGQLAWPGATTWANLSPMFGMSGAGVFGLLFTRQFLGTRHNQPQIDRAILILTAGFGGSFALTIGGQYRLALYSVSALAIGFLCVSALASWRAMRHGHSGARYFLLAWVVMLGGACVVSLKNFGWVPTNIWTNSAFQIGSALEMLLLSFALADRIQVERHAREQAQAEALQANQRTKAELELRVAERTAELEAANHLLQESELKQRELAQHDALTGLANRARFSDRLHQAITMAQRDGNRFALLYIDLDRFKPVNDTFGHAIGDTLLCQVANRIRACVRESDTVARIGGDEFVVLLRTVEGPADASLVGEKIRTELERPFDISTPPCTISCSIGIALYPEHGKTEHELSGAADRAMYRAKDAGRNTIRLA